MYGQHIVAIFQTSEAANAAKSRLIEAGVDHTSIGMSSSDPGSMAPAETGGN